MARVMLNKSKRDWGKSAVFYQIYPLGFCGAPFENDGKPESRILKVLDWIPHMKKLGINAIYFSPVFSIIIYSLFSFFASIRIFSVSSFVNFSAHSTVFGSAFFTNLTTSFIGKIS